MKNLVKYVHTCYILMNLMYSVLHIVRINSMAIRHSIRLSQTLTHHNKYKNMCWTKDFFSLKNC